MGNQLCHKLKQRSLCKERSTWRELGVAYLEFLQTADCEIFWFQFAFYKSSNLNKSKTTQIISIIFCSHGATQLYTLRMLSKQFSRYFTLCETTKVLITSFKSLTRQMFIFLIYRNVPDSVLSHIRFTDTEYLHWFSRYGRFCELWHLWTGALIRL